MEVEIFVLVQVVVNLFMMILDMRFIINNSLDFFFNGGLYYLREQSIDSGLGLGCYSVFIILEDFFSNVDEMDIGENVG